MGSIREKKISEQTSPKAQNNFGRLHDASKTRKYRHEIANVLESLDDYARCPAADDNAFLSDEPLVTLAKTIIES